MLKLIKKIFIPFFIIGLYLAPIFFQNHEANIDHDQLWITHIIAIVIIGLIYTNNVVWTGLFISAISMIFVEGILHDKENYNALQENQIFIYYYLAILFISCIVILLKSIKQNNTAKQTQITQLPLDVRLLTPTLAVCLISAAVGLIHHLTYVQLNLSEQNAIQHAEQHISMVHKIRTTYSEEIINIVKEKGISISHDFKNNPHSIPLPALFAKLITDEITKDDLSISTKLASPYPFPWQLSRHFKQDRFLVDAWAFLNQTPNKAYFKIHNVNDQFILHYTIADIMVESCVACHNSHPESPKKDWKVGDIGGILDVQISMNHVSKLINQQLSQTLVLFSLISIFIVLAAGLIIFKHRRYIHNIQHYIDQQTHDLALEVKQRKLFAEQSLLTRQEAEQANKAKSEFLANMSHELRTPMHGILSFARLGIKNVEKGDFQKLAKYFDRINISGERLLILLNDLLDLAKLETGQIKLQKETGNLRQLADTCVAEQEAWSKEKNITIAWKTFEKNITAEFDSPKIVQVISNLLSNAIKFSPENKQISLSCVAQDYLLIANKKPFPVLLFSIEDEGVGIPEAELNDIFDKFIQSSKTKTNAGGTGLGLAICKEIIEAHQGKIWAENAPEGGAIFKFIIPCSNELDPTKTRPM